MIIRSIHLYYYTPRKQSSSSTKEMKISTTKIRSLPAGLCKFSFIRGNQQSIFHGLTSSVPAVSKVDHMIETQLGQMKDYKIGISCCNGKKTKSRSRSKQIDWE